MTAFFVRHSRNGYSGAAKKPVLFIAVCDQGAVLTQAIYLSCNTKRLEN